MNNIVIFFSLVNKKKMKVKKTEEEAISETFRNYIILGIFAVFVLTIVFIMIYVGLHQLVGLDKEFLTTKQVYMSRIITGLIFAAYVLVTYLTLNFIITEYHAKVAIIIEKEQIGKEKIDNIKKMEKEKVRQEFEDKKKDK